MIYIFISVMLAIPCLQPELYFLDLVAKSTFPHLFVFFLLLLMRILSSG